MRQTDSTVNKKKKILNARTNWQLQFGNTTAWLRKFGRVRYWYLMHSVLLKGTHLCKTSSCGQSETCFCWKQFVFVPCNTMPFGTVSFDRRTYVPGVYSYNNVRQNVTNYSSYQPEKRGQTRSTYFFKKNISH